MSDFTFLTNEQCFEGDKLDILRKRGIKAAITDFSVLLGGWVSSEHVENDSSLEGRTGYYWTKLEGRASNNVVDDEGNIRYDEEYTRKNSRIRNGYFRHRLEQLPMPEAEILLDTSGSVSEVLLKNFLRECKIF